MLTQPNIVEINLLLIKLKFPNLKVPENKNTIRDQKLTRIFSPNYE